MSQKQANKQNKFHFENGLLKELRAKAAPVNKTILKSAKKIALEAAKSSPPKSILASLSKSQMRRLLKD